MTTNNPVLAFLDDVIKTSETNRAAKANTTQVNNVPTPTITLTPTPPVSDPAVIKHVSAPAPGAPVTPVEQPPADPATEPTDPNLNDFTPPIPEIEVNDPLPPDPEKEIDDLLDIDDTDEKVIAKKAVKENFNKIRNYAKTKKDLAKELETKLTETTGKLEAYEKGEILPEVFKSTQERISHLEKFEKIHDLKSSPEWIREVATPLDNLSDELTDLAEDYNVNTESITAALSIRNARERNEHFAKLFKKEDGTIDQLGVDDAKDILDRMDSLHKRARDLEQEPVAALDRLKVEHKTAIERERVRRNRAINEDSKAAWQESIVELREEGSAANMLIKNGDREYVEKNVKPMWGKAALEYGRLINELTSSGLTDLKPETAKGLAKLVIKAYNSALSDVLAGTALDELETTIKGAQRINNLIRPQTGASLPASMVVKQPEKPITAKDRGMDLITSVLPKR